MHKLNLKRGSSWPRRAAIRSYTNDEARVGRLSSAGACKIYVCRINDQFALHNDDKSCMRCSAKRGTCMLVHKRYAPGPIGTSSLLTISYRATEGHDASNDSADRERTGARRHGCARHAAASCAAQRSGPEWSQVWLRPR